MREGNVRVRERFELALDGRQIASIVVGAHVILGVVFFLGLNVGKHLATARVEAARAAGDLAALDAVPAPPGPAAPKDEITFFKELPRAKPSAPVAEAPPAAPPVPPPVAAPPPSPDAAHDGEVGRAPGASAPAPVEPGASPPGPAEPEPSADAPPARGRWAVQLAAARDRGEIEGLAQRLRRFSPRIEVADIPGKGRYYRLRAGGFDTREAAERYRRDLERETGVNGFVTAAP
jgi:cell division septation protein DedD